MTRILNYQYLYKYMLVVLAVTGLSILSANAEDRIQMDTTAIIGNKELPKMLYIVPWKNSELPEMNAPPIESLIDEALAPVDREALKRQIRYYQIYSQQHKTQNENQ